jgi:hypothetical protein
MTDFGTALEHRRNRGFATRRPFALERCFVDSNVCLNIHGRRARVSLIRRELT